MFTQPQCRKPGYVSLLFARRGTTRWAVPAASLSWNRKHPHRLAKFASASRGAAPTSLPTSEKPTSLFAVLSMQWRVRARSRVFRARPNAAGSEPSWQKKSNGVSANQLCSIVINTDCPINPNRNRANLQRPAGELVAGMSSRACGTKCLIGGTSESASKSPIF